MSFRSIVWDDEEKTMRGSFVNMSITFIYLCMIVAGLIWGIVADNIQKMETFLIGFFAVSFFYLGR